MNEISLLDRRDKRKITVNNINDLVKRLLEVNFGIGIKRPLKSHQIDIHNHVIENNFPEQNKSLKIKTEFINYEEQMEQQFNCWQMDVYTSMQSSMLQLKYEECIGVCDIQLEQRTQLDENKIQLTNNNMRYFDFQHDEFKAKFKNYKDQVKIVSIDKDLKANDALLFFTLHEQADQKFNQPCNPIRNSNLMHQKLPLRIGDLFIATEVHREECNKINLDDPFCDQEKIDDKQQRKPLIKKLLQFNGFVDSQDQKDKHKLAIKISPSTRQVLTDEKIQKTFWFIKMDQFSTYVREYLALKQMEFTKQCNFLLSPKNIPRLDKIDIREKFNPTLFKNLNRSQIEAIYGVIETGSPLSLIHGPPGTGKTQTIVGLLDLIHLVDNKPNILICAPSNGAIDELVFRIMYSGFANCNLKPKLVRIGRSTEKSVNQLVSKATLETLAQEQKSSSGESEEVLALRKRISDNDEMLARLKKKPKDGTVEPIINQTIKDNQRLYKQLEKKTQGPKRGMTGQDMIKIENQILDEFNIYASTLSTSAIERISKKRTKFKQLIIDEAGQTTEPSTLIPLKQDFDKIILIGDHKQLPATVFNEHNKHLGFDISLFERMMKNDVDSFILTEQQRMHPKIRLMPSEMFQEGKLVDGHCVQNYDDKVMYPLQSQFKKRVVFVNINYSKERREGDETSCFNDSECNLIGNFVNRFCNKFSNQIENDKKNFIGIISPYKKQVFKLKTQIAHKSRLEINQKKLIEIETIDGFQGREKDIILFSTVRSGDKIGFLKDQRRMNVGLTRAKHLLIVFGRLETLINDQKWAKFLDQVNISNCRIDLQSEQKVNEDEYMDKMIDQIKSDGDWKDQDDDQNQLKRKRDNQY